MNAPHSLEAERAVIGSILLKPEALNDVATGLQVDDMYLPQHRDILATMLDLQRAKTPLDQVVIADELKRRGVLTQLEGGFQYLINACNELPTAENVRYYAKIVREKAKLRALIRIGTELAEQAADGAETSMETAERAMRALGDATRENETKLIRMRDAVTEAMLAIENRARSEGKPIGIPWGLGMLDRLTGGLHRGRMTVVAARPGGGKTALASNVVTRAALLGIPALVIELEMAAADMAERSLLYDAHMNSGDLQAGRVDFDGWKKLQSSAGRLAETPVEFFQGTASMGEIEAVARRWRARTPDAEDRNGKTRQPLVVIDYLGRIRADQRGQSREAEVAGFSNRIKDLAMDQDVAMLALVQLNRECEKEQRAPRISDLRDSGSIEQDADVIAFLHADYEAPEASETREVILGKNRFGATAKETVSWVAHRMALFDLAGDDREPDPAPDHEPDPRYAD